MGWNRRVGAAIICAAMVAPFAPLARAAFMQSWHTATERELEAALPARAPVEKERIETEMRTASGIADDHGRIVAGVVLITAGYSADGKYSHYLVVGAPVRLGDVTLKPGQYVFGWKRAEDGLQVHLYEASTGNSLGVVTAQRMPSGTAVESFRILPPGEHGMMQIGRFGVPYVLLP